MSLGGLFAVQTIVSNGRLGNSAGDIRAGINSTCRYDKKGFSDIA